MFYESALRRILLAVRAESKARVVIIVDEGDRRDGAMVVKAHAVVRQLIFHVLRQQGVGVSLELRAIKTRGQHVNLIHFISVFERGKLSSEEVKQDDLGDIGVRKGA